MKTNTLKIVIITILCLSVALMVVACNKKIDKNDKITFTSENWMARLDNNTFLSQISIPATHDSGAFMNFAFTQCQNLTIAEQLKIGIRCFDIRLGFDNNEEKKLHVYHGIFPQTISFENILSDFENFLNNNPTETIMIFIKNENDEDKTQFFNALNIFFEDNENLFYLENTIPALGEVRGKVVLLNRFDSAKNVGLQCSDGWKDNAMFEMNNGVNCFVQDYYCLDDEKQLETKWEYFKKLTEINTKNNYVFNFTSGYVALTRGLPDIKTVAEYMHEKLVEEFSAMPDGNYGIILLDFADENLSKMIYEKNFD